MKKVVVVLLILISMNSYSQNAEVQETITTFFEGFHAQDAVKIESVCNANLILQSIAATKEGNKLTTDDVSKFIKSIVTIPANIKFEEKILSYNIQIDGAMAHAWTPYEFYVNGKLSHSGVNAFTLFKEQEKWKIVHVIDTRRK